MLIEQIIEFQLRGPGPPGCTRTPVSGYFLDKTKTSKENLQVNYYYLLVKYCRRRQVRSQKFAMGGAVLGVCGRSPQPLEVNGGLGAKPPTARGWGLGSKILHFFAKIT